VEVSCGEVGWGRGGRSSSCLAEEGGRGVGEHGARVVVVGGGENEKRGGRWREHCER
jgi:hypothetical protein